MIKKILVPTDGSEYSRRALEMAIQLGRPFNAEIILLHVVATPEALGYILSEDATVIQDQLILTGEQALKSTYEGLDFEGVTIVTKNSPGYPASVIVSEIIDQEVDLVVMGCHGYGPFKGTLMGSVSQKVLMKSNKPVLLVK